MWMRFADRLRCPQCKGALGLRGFEDKSVTFPEATLAHARELGVYDERFGHFIESGVMLCEPCRAMYPVVDGLPILLAYTTPMHEAFIEREARAFSKEIKDYRFPQGEPADGERAVMRSFSKEWLGYDYDGVIWEMSYEDHERRFLQEAGPAIRDPALHEFLEVGCGLGITTYLAHKNAGCDAVGLDLSLAVWKAARHYRDNPFLHFVQASAFAMPFADHSFGFVYSRGVLHHTFSTQKAFESLAKLCRPEGTVYLWVYGIGSIRETIFRRLAYTLERVFRPPLSAAPNSIAARAFLATMGMGYVAFNGLRRRVNPAIQPLTLARGIHAARDRFTPQFAHRHEANEVTDWFRHAGFGEPELLDWQSMPQADHDDFRRNIGVRGKRLHG